MGSIAIGEADLGEVLCAYGPDCRAETIESLGSAGGFSGAGLWHLASRCGQLCLRRWPREHPTQERLEQIHAVLRHVHRAGFQLVPVPLDTSAARSFVEHAGHLWELAPWMPGAPNRDQPSKPERLEAALAALAQFHLAAASFPLPPPRQAVSPGIGQRYEQLCRLTAGDIERLASAIDPSVWPEGATTCRRIVELFPRAAGRVAALLKNAMRLQVPITPCLRDIWSDHVLFVGDRVTGLIDFGAMKPDNVAGDVARLLGSMAGDDPRRWEQGLAAFGSIRPLSDAELTLVHAFDRSTVLLSGLNWIEWIYCDRRSFENTSAIAQRLAATLARLEHLVSSF